ncbi:MAG: hypothetical protein GF416_07275 [Candidatus Altiarchaeales archaeon]|nr:hypothetical protein [Candidatus Altiarchaeales archaeon]MBD3416913.1 hypothetical protein [Candidatus Altiarchaeales archaeon]
MDRLGAWGVLSAALVLLSFSASPVSCQAADLKVKIINSLPKVYDVRSSPPSEYGVVWCAGVAEDLNSMMDIKSASAFMGAPSAGGFSDRLEADFTTLREESTIKGRVYAAFVVDPPPPGMACVIEVSDNAGDKGLNHSIMSNPPSSCKNGLQDEGEEGVDCGGGCVYCQSLGDLSLEAPLEIVSGEEMTVQVTSAGEGVEALVMAFKPSGESIFYGTDESGFLEMKADETGRWKLVAELYGYKPSEKSLEVRASLMSYVIPALVLLVIVVAVVVVVSRKRKSQG